MDTRTKTILLWSTGAILFVAGIVTLIFSFGGSEEKISEVDLIYTNAALTIIAQEQTLQAGLLSATPNVALLITPTVTDTLLPSPTFQQQVPTSTTVAGVITGCDNSVYISDVTIPDGTLVAPGQTFTKTWKVSNNGTCAWTATYQIIFISGDAMGGKATAIGKIVNPGESVDVSVTLTAPAAAPNITGTWRLSNDKGQPFGTPLTAVIKTGATTGTVSVTATKTSNGTASVATSTNTVMPTTAVPGSWTAVPTSTNTPAPTNTPTITATP